MEFNPAEQRSQLRDNVPPELADAYDRIVAAGMKFMFDKSTHEQAISFLQQQGPLDDKLATGIAFLMMNLMKKSNNTMPGELIIPAGIDLILQAAEYAEKTGLDQVTPEVIASSVQKYVFMIAKKAGISEQQLMGGVDKLSAMAKQGA